MADRPAQPASPSGSLLGHELELTVGGPAAGGSCVARTAGEHGRVVFVRHALPGERVRARVTDDRGGAFCRADAVEILVPAPGRVPPPCPHAGPGRCGGCDWQHATHHTQRELKATVVREQFARLAGLDLADDVFGGVEELPGGPLGWRTRIAYSATRDGRLGLLRHGSHEIEPLGACPLGVPGVGDADALTGRWPGLRAVEVVAPGDDGAAGDAGTGPTVIAHRAAARPKRGRGRRGPDRLEVVSGPARVRHRVAGVPLTVAATGFWQGHPAAADTLAAAVLDAAGPRPGERVLELFAGAGPLTAVLAAAVGPHGAVTGIEGDRQAVADAAANLEPWPWARVHHGRVTAAAVTAAAVTEHTGTGHAGTEHAGTGHAGESGGPDIVVLDPPRAGAGAAVMDAIAALAPRAVVYVSCDAATLARDVTALGAHGWRLSRLRGFDAFPMTRHVECVAALHPGQGTRPT